MERRHATYLLTPGPLTTSDSVKQAMLHDKSPNSPEMVALNREACRYLLELANGVDSHVCVPLQGSGTYACEAAFQTLIDRQTSKVLVLVNGFYGIRLKEILDAIRMPAVAMELPIVPPPSAQQVEDALIADPTITHVALCHCDTGTGILNPLNDIAEVCQRRGVKLMVDAIASFGGFRIDAKALGLEALVISPNKCLQGVPGIAFVVVDKTALDGGAGRSPSTSLDLHAQHAFLAEKGWFRFTPPTHVLLAFAQALKEHRDEGGIDARNARYQRNWRRLVDGLRQQGFDTFLPDAHASPIVATFHDPDDPAYDFQKFYAAMERRGFVIFPGRTTAAHTFRIGCLGDLTEADMALVVNAVEECMAEIGVTHTRAKADRLIAA